MLCSLSSRTSVWANNCSVQFGCKPTVGRMRATPKKIACEQGGGSFASCHFLPQHRNRTRSFISVAASAGGDTV
jgi:hypothetical protein